MGDITVAEIDFFIDVEVFHAGVHYFKSGVVVKGGTYVEAIADVVFPRLAFGGIGMDDDTEADGENRVDVVVEGPILILPRWHKRSKGGLAE